MRPAAQGSTQEERYLAAFERLEKNGLGSGQAWARRLRRQAITRFAELGFPVERRGNEEWKYTDIGPLARVPFQPLLEPWPARLQARELELLGWDRLVFVDGIYVPDLSSLSSLPPGVVVENLAEAMDARADLVEPHLARYADFRGNAFTALNTAFVHHGALVHIPEGVQLEEPLHLLFLSTAPRPDTVSFPRVLVLMGRDSQATLIESYEGLSPERYFTNAVTEVVVGPGAGVRYYRVQREGVQAFHIHTTQVVQAWESHFSSVTLDLGGRLVRNNLNVLLEGEGSSCMLNGVYIVGGVQHVDNQVIIDHAGSSTTSRELYKGILEGKSRAVFHGSIVVRPGTRKVDARQEDKNLVLSDEAEADTKPAFWIYSDDVRCSHGAACGKLDENALFYLRTRGLEEKAARRLLIRGFVGEVIQTISSQPFHAYADRLVMDKLEEI